MYLKKEGEAVYILASLSRIFGFKTEHTVMGQQILRSTGEELEGMWLWQMKTLYACMKFSITKRISVEYSSNNL